MIITAVKDNNIDVFNLQYPNQLLSEKEKLSEEYIKNALDFFWNTGIGQITHNKRSFGRNYDLVKGNLTPQDFYQESVLPDFMEMEINTNEDELPNFVQDYSIILAPLSTLKGEMSKRPDNLLIRAMDDESQSEENEFKTELLHQYVTQQVKQNIIMKYAQQGKQITEEELDQISEQELQDKLTNYTSQIERWGSRVIEALKLRLSLKEKSEEAFNDLLISAREYFHIYEDNSTLGFNVEVTNPTNTFYLTTPGKKYISDPLDEANGAYCAGTIVIMELSEILHKYNLSKDEIKHLQWLSKEQLPILGPTSNLFTSETGEDSINYTRYSRLLQREKLFIDSYLNENPSTDTFLQFTRQTSTFGNKFSVMQVYWCSKVKICKLTYLDENNEPVSTLVDENYKKGTHPNEVDLQCGWTNQWWKGTRIGPDIYIDVQPFTLLEYCPIIGCVFEPKNLTKIKSFVDSMKSFSTMYNIFINKLYEKIQQDWGNVILTSIRHISVPEDADYQDAISLWEDQARQRGVIFVDDSPENTKGASAFNQHTVLQASRAQEMESYLKLAQGVKMEAWQLAGINPQRVGEVAATQTATGTQTAMAQSYSQTEPLFAQHEYVINKLYQALLDAAQYIFSHKGESTLSYITNEGDKGAIQITGEDLRLKDLWVFATSRSEDNANLQSLKQLSQAMLQNGASPYEIALLYNSKSSRYITDAFKRLKDQNDAMKQQQQQTEQQQLQQQQQQFEQQQQIAIQQHQADQENDNYNKEADRQSKERVALINASGYGKITPPDTDQNQIPDVYELGKIDLQRQKLDKDHELKQQKLMQEQLKIIQQTKDAEENRKLQEKKIDVEKEKIKSTERIAKVNKNKFDKK